MIAGWALVWVIPGLYFGVVKKNIGDIAKAKEEVVQGSKLLYVILFWAAWGVVASVKWGSLLWIMGLHGWWLKGAWLAWVGLFGI